MPPNSSGTSTPVQPSSAHSCQNTREKPSPCGSARSLRNSAIGAFAAIAPRALSISIFWSSLSTSMAASIGGEFEQPLGDNVEHDLGRAALDRVALRAQPASRYVLRRATIAVEIKSFRSGERHQELVPALVEFGAVVFEQRRARADFAAVRRLGEVPLPRRPGRVGVDRRARDLGAQDGVGKLSVVRLRL